MSAHERTGWRDEALSQRHRTWGFNCPAVDIDFLMCEYDEGKVVGLVEYKHHVGSVTLDTPTMSALADLCGGRFRPIPLFVVRYWPEIWAFRVLPVNAQAKTFCVDNPHWVDEDNEMALSEREYVELLHRIRGRKCDVSLEALNTERIPNAARALLESA